MRRSSRREGLRCVAPADEAHERAPHEIVRRGRDSSLDYKRSLPRNSGGRLLKKRKRATYCPGDSAGVSSVPAGDSVVLAGASVAAGLVSVVAGAVVGAGVVAGVTVSVFCSHAARRAAPARMQMNFFIIGDAYCFNRLIAASAVFRPTQNVVSRANRSRPALKRCLPFQAMRFGYGLASEPAITRVDPTNQRRLFFARALKAEIG